MRAFVRVCLCVDLLLCALPKGGGVDAIASTFAHSLVTVERLKRPRVKHLRAIPATQAMGDGFEFGKTGLGRCALWARLSGRCWARLVGTSVSTSWFVSHSCPIDDRVIEAGQERYRIKKGEKGNAIIKEKRKI